MKKPDPPNQNILDKSILKQIDSLAKKHPPRGQHQWTPKERAILKAAYGKIKSEILHEKLLPRHTADAIKTQARKLGLTRNYSH